MPRVPVALVTTALCLTLALTACGQKAEQAPDTGEIVPKATRTLNVAGLGPAKRFEGFGHSYMGAYGVRPQVGFFTLVAKHFRVTGGQTGGGGSSVVDQLSDVYARNLPRRSGPRVQLAIVMWGINDVAAYGRPVLPAFKNGLTSLLSRIRAAPGDAYAFNDPTVKLGTGWSASGAVASAPGDAQMDITLPRRAGQRTLGFVAPASQGTGALYRFKVDGKAAGSLDTRGLFPAKPKKSSARGTPFIKRVRIPEGGRTLHVDVTNVQGSASFYGWHLEAAKAPLIVVLHQPRPPAYFAFDGTYHEPDTGDVSALNAATDDVIASFSDGRVTAADAERELHGDTVFFQDDRIHPNEIGHQWLAKVSISALEDAARRLRQRAGS